MTAEQVQFGDGGTLDCVAFEAMLTDAIDGLLPGSERVRFERHATGCGPCGELYRAIREGMEALESLDEVAAPEHLVHNILAQTSYAESRMPLRTAGAVERPGWAERVRRALHPVLQPRFAMSMAMAFFSITLLLNVAGVSRKDMRTLRPGAMRTTAMVKLNEAEGRIVSYYENLRIVYEFESLMRQVDDQKKPEKKKEKADDTSWMVTPVPVGREEMKLSQEKYATKQSTQGPSQTQTQQEKNSKREERA